MFQNKIKQANMNIESKLHIYHHELIIRILSVFYFRDYSFGKIVKSVLSLILIINMLTISTPAAPQLIIGSVNQIHQNAVIALSSGGWYDNIISKVFRYLRGEYAIQETQETRNSKVVRIESNFPETIVIGGQIQLEAIPYDYNDIPVSGIKLNWEIECPNGELLTELQGLFTFEQIGQHKITVSISGRETVSYISVTELSNFTKVDSKNENDSKITNEQTTENLRPIDEWNSTNIDLGLEPRNNRGDVPGRPKENSNFNIIAPVLAVEGRAGLDTQLNLFYNSRVWTKMGQNVSFDMDKDIPAPGWTLGYGKILNFVEGGIVQFNEDGSKRAFNGQVKYESYKRIFEGQSNDGSFVKNRTETSGTSVSGQPCYNNATSQLRYPDGTTISYSASISGCVFSGNPITMLPTYISDKHGNYISIVYHPLAEQQNGKFINFITDTLGRVYKFNYTQIDNKYYITSITGPGLQDENGVVIERTFVRLAYKNHFLSYQFNGLTPQVREDNLKVISAIYYPSTSTGYWFGDSDSYSPYGMIRKVEEQKTMSFNSSTGIISPGQTTRKRIFSYPENTSTALNDIPEYSTVTETWDGMPDPNLPAITQYVIDWTSNPRTTTVVLPYQQGKTVEYSYNIPNSPKNGVSFKTEFYDNSNVLRTRDETDWDIGNLSFLAHSNSVSYNINVIRPKSVIRTEFENGVSLTKKIVYDQYGQYNRAEVMRELGYDGETLRKTVIQYIDKENLTVSPYGGWSGTRVINLPKIIEAFDSNNSRIDYTEYTYDLAPVNLYINSGGIPNHYSPSCPSNYPCSQVMVERGNLSNIIKYSKISNSNLEGVHKDGRIYDQVGNIITYYPSTEPSNLSYSTFSSDTGFAYPKIIARGSGDNASAYLKNTFSYDINTSLALSVIDIDQQITQFNYDLETWRLKKTVLPTGAYMVSSFDDANRKSTQTSYASTGAIAGKRIGISNGLNQPYRQETLAGYDQNNAEVYDVVEIKYDGLGRIKKTSNPFRSNESANGIYWSEIFYDWAGRVEKTKSPNGSEKTNFYNEAVRPQGASNYSGNTYRMKDSVGQEKWYRTNVEGNIAEVIEPNPDGNGSVSTGGLLTKYSYDKLGRLILTEQGSQERKFRYDSLGRLTHQKLAETKSTLDDTGTFVGESSGQWSDYFTYDAMSNISSSIDARGVKTNYSYLNPELSYVSIDPLNRLFSISYETNSALNVLPSPTVKYTYSTTGNVSQTKSVYTENIVNGNSQRVTTLDLSYDSFGRIAEKKTTLANRQDYPMTINYNYDSLSRETDIYYPQPYGLLRGERKNIHNDYDVAGRVNGLKVNGADYASNFAFNAFSQITSVKIGQNGANQINETYGYNPQTGLLENQKVTKGGTSLLDLSYEYQQCSCSTGGSGKITKIVNNIDRNKDRAYNYDALGRLKKVTGGVNQSWAQSYNYDRFGNRYNVTSTGFEALRSAQQSNNSNGNQEKIVKDSIPNATLLTKDNLLNNVNNLVTNKVESFSSNNSNPLQKESEKLNKDQPNYNENELPDNEVDNSNNKENITGKNSTENQNLTTTLGTPFDFDGDGKADFSTWRRNNGNWSIYNRQTGQTDSLQLGSTGNQIAPGDYDGDGKTDKATWNPSNGLWTIKYSSNGNIVTQYWGGKGDAIVPADYDGDHKTDIAVWRPSDGNWYIIKSSDNTWYAINFGGQQFGDIPIVEDYDGDGRADVAVWRPNGGNWYIYVLQSSGSQVLSFQWGQAGDVPVVADYDGDHKADLAVWRPTTGSWYIYQSSNGQYISVAVGSEATKDVLVPADYDGDGKTDVAVWTPSTGVWTVRQSTTGTNITHQLGTNGDVAVPSAFIRRSSAPKGQSVEVPRDGHENLSFDSTSNRINTNGFEYDLAGNQTRIVKPDGSILRFQYDAAGRMTKVKNDNNQTIVTYAYGIGRERLITQEGDENSTNFTYYTWDGETVISEFTESVGSLRWSKNYIYLGGLLLATQDKNGNDEILQFHHSDRLGISLITNPNSGTYFEQSTLPFGTALESETTGSTNRRFTSYDRSYSTGLDYANSRHYDSSQGRFTSVDPIQMSSTKVLNPQTLNLYSYTANDPINRTDPSGLDWGVSVGWFSFGFGWGSGGLPGASSNSFFTGLGQFLTGLLGSIFNSGGYPIASFIQMPINTGSMVISAPPPLPGAGTISSVVSPTNTSGDCDVEILKRVYVADRSGDGAPSRFPYLHFSVVDDFNAALSEIYSQINQVATDVANSKGYMSKAYIRTRRELNKIKDAIGVTELFRTYEHQKKLYKLYKSGKSTHTAADPDSYGFHQLGAAFDMKVATQLLTINGKTVRQIFQEHNFVWFGVGDDVHFTHKSFLDDFSGPNNKTARQIIANAASDYFKNCTYSF